MKFKLALLGLFSLLLFGALFAFTSSGELSGSISGNAKYGYTSAGEKLVLFVEPKETVGATPIAIPLDSWNAFLGNLPVSCSVKHDFQKTVSVFVDNGPARQAKLVEAFCTGKSIDKIVAFSGTLSLFKGRPAIILDNGEMGSCGVVVLRNEASGATLGEGGMNSAPFWKEESKITDYIGKKVSLFGTAVGISFPPWGKCGPYTVADVVEYKLWGDLKQELSFEGSIDSATLSGSVGTVPVAFTIGAPLVLDSSASSFKGKRVKVTGVVGQKVEISYGSSLKKITAYKMAGAKITPVGEVQAKGFILPIQVDEPLPSGEKAWRNVLFTFGDAFVLEKTFAPSPETELSKFMTEGKNSAFIFRDENVGQEASRIVRCGGSSHLPSEGEDCTEVDESFGGITGVYVGQSDSRVVECLNDAYKSTNEGDPCNELEQQQYKGSIFFWSQGETKPFSKPWWWPKQYSAVVKPSSFRPLFGQFRYPGSNAEIKSLEVDTTEYVNFVFNDGWNLFSTPACLDPNSAEEVFTSEDGDQKCDLLLTYLSISPAGDNSQLGWAIAYNLAPKSGYFVHCNLPAPTAFKFRIDSEDPECWKEFN